MQKPSALTAALSAPGGGTTAAPQQSNKLDSSSFPCIEEGKPLEAAVAASFENLQLGSKTIVGSMPTRTLSGGFSVSRRR